MPVLEPCGCQLVRGTNEFRRRCDLHSADKAEVERLRGLLREARGEMVDWLIENRPDLVARIDAALAGATDQPTAVPFPMGKFPECEADVSPTSDNGNEGRQE